MTKVVGRKNVTQWIAHSIHFYRIQSMICQGSQYGITVYFAATKSPENNLLSRSIASTQAITT